MNIEGRKVLVLGGYGLVGTAVCRELIAHHAREIQIHSLRPEEARQAKEELASEAGDTNLTTSAGDIFGLDKDVTRREGIWAQINQLTNESLGEYLLYGLLVSGKPDIVVDCVNTATAIAYRNIFGAAEELWKDASNDAVAPERADALLEALYTPRLIRHVQVLYRGMIDAGTKVYIKVGTTGTGGMGLNVPYTHSEEKPSRVLLSKSAVAGAHSMLLFLMARTPDAPVTKEIKPAAAIAWKKIGYGPIRRRGNEISLVEGKPHSLGTRFSTLDPEAGRDSGKPLETVFIDTGENGIFSVEEFALLTTGEQMEFVTPEEIAQYLIFEIEGANTGHDVINALDSAVLGPTYRAGLLRHWALERMNDLEREHETRSVAFEMLGPPRNSKLLFEAHLLRETFATMSAVSEAGAEKVRDALDEKVRTQPDSVKQALAVGIPVLLDSGEILRGPRVLVPSEAQEVEVTPERVDRWVDDGWIDLRLDNCRRWIERFARIHREIEEIPATDSSSRYLRNRRFWDEQGTIQPGKIVGWILSVEERGARIKR